MDAEQLRRLVGQAAPRWEEIREIRFRAGKPILFLTDEGERALYEDGRLGEPEGRPEREPEGGAKHKPGHGTAGMVLADRGLIRELLEIFSRHSLYAFEDEIRRGFLTIEGGHRVGIAGRVVLEGDRIRTIKDAAALNLRLAHERKGCGNPVLPWLFRDGELLDTLILSPPGAGKTTLLRDLVRQLSEGGPHGPGMNVSVVDERSEIGACFQGVPQCDLGLRTDVLDGCPKADGLLMMIRSMAPQVAAVDEIGTKEDLEAIQYGMNCGCRILATVHGTSVAEIRQKPILRQMAEAQLFSRYVVLSGQPKAGTVVGIYDEALREVEGREEGKQGRRT